MKFIRVLKAGDDVNTEELAFQLDKIYSTSNKIGRGIITKFISDLKLDENFSEEYYREMIDSVELDDISIYEQIKKENKVEEAINLLRKINRNPEEHILRG